jgi:head-tail adaptor
MEAGALDQVIMILEPTVVIDEVGDEKESWALVLTCWASKREIGSLEIMRNPAIKGELSALFTVRSPGVVLDARMRVQDAAGRIYAITGLAELPRRGEGLEIMAKGLDATGATVA